MNITSMNPYKSVIYTKNVNMNTNDKEIAFSISSATDDVQKVKADSPIWEEISKKYDVRTATFKDITEISKALYDAGEISLKEVAFLSFDNERASRNLETQCHTARDSNFT